MTRHPTQRIHGLSLAFASGGMIISGKPSGEDSSLKVWDGINSLDQVIIDHPNAPSASLWIWRRRAQKAIDRASDAVASPDLGTTR